LWFLLQKKKLDKGWFSWYNGYRKIGNGGSMAEVKLLADVGIVPKKKSPIVLRPITVGFLIRYKSTRKSIRQKFLDHVEAQRQPNQEKKLYTKLPCGLEYVFTYDDFPNETMPCKCGNPDHFVVKYERFNPKGPTPISTNKATLFLPQRGEEGEEGAGLQDTRKGEVSKERRGDV
jgi:hypothetical protein